MLNAVAGSGAGTIDHFGGGTIVRANDTWTYDTLDEWLAEYSTQPDGAGLSGGDGPIRFSFGWTGRPGAWSDDVGSTLEVAGPEKEKIERVFLAFEEATAPQTVPLNVFIGHGRSSAWRELADVLEKRFDVRTTVFDYLERAGLDVRGALSEMLGEATFAILILTAEDETAAGDLRSRQNVVHEVGLFQGRLGFDKAIVLLEDGCETFSNLAGTLYVGFAPGSIEVAVGRVISTLRREFGPI